MFEHGAPTLWDADIENKMHERYYYGAEPAYVNSEDVDTPDCAVAKDPFLLFTSTAAGKRPVSLNHSTTGNVQVGDRYGLDVLLDLEEQSRVCSGCLSGSCACEDHTCEDYGCSNASSPITVVDESEELLDIALTSAASDRVNVVDEKKGACLGCHWDRMRE
jgi:hypothetical protein